MSKTILIRCDADEKSGFGHFSRCLNLARGIFELSQENKIIFIGNFNALATQLLSEFGFGSLNASEDREEQLNRAKEGDYFILDSYFIDQDYIDLFCDQGFKFIKIDDFHDMDLEKVDLVVNFRLNIDEKAYRSKRLCLGTDYFPVRKELRDLRMRNLSRFSDEMRNILVFIGGVDQDRAGEAVVRVLDDFFKGLQITLITNQVNQMEYESQHNEIKTITMSYDIDKYFNEANLIITGGGLTKYECAYCCVPNAAISQNDGQAIDTTILAKEGLTYDLGMAKDIEKDKEGFTNRIKNLCSPKVRREIYEKTKEKFKTESTRNLVLAVLET